QLSCTRVPDSEGGILCSLVSVVNITEQRQMEEAFKRTYGKLQESIEFMPDPTFIVDRNKKVVAWNHAMEGFTGISKEGMLGRGDLDAAFPFFEGVRPILIDLIDVSAEEIAKSYPNVRLFGDSIFTEAYIPTLHDGRGAYIWGKASRLSDDEGCYIGAIESMRDISDWKRAEDSLRQVYDRSRVFHPKE
ncbi:MAG TPA: PAS domain-containing protein, partial [Methanomicrobiales archaeon]|nr:PAS domain-containing protein [Methanomicrobiales archaeon]